MLPSFSSEQFTEHRNPNPQISLQQYKQQQQLNILSKKSKELTLINLNKSKSLNQSKNIKQKSKESFQKHLKTIDDFNLFIDKQYAQMTRQKSQNPTLMIPKGFQSFIKSKLFQNLIQKIYQYMSFLISSQQKFTRINKISSQYQPTFRYSPSLIKMRSQSYQLSQKCKQISYIYMGILLSYGQSKLIFKDQYFFQTMIYFIAQIMKQLFQQSQEIMIIQQQLNRIFRTNTFNLIRRRNQQDNICQKYPQLKQGKYQPSGYGVNRVIKRLIVQKKFNYSQQIKIDKIEKIRKPVQIDLSSFGSVKSRSPLISSFYPSSKEKLYQFGKSARERDSFIKHNSKNRANSMSLFCQMKKMER